MENNYPSPPKGLICPVITPLKKDNTLDSASFGKLLGHVSQFVNGILLCDVTWGEGLILPKETRLDLVTSALETIMGRLPIFVTITGRTLKDSRIFMAHVESFADRIEYQGNIFWVDYPLFYHSNRDLPQMYRHLIAETQFPLILGNLPSLIKTQKSTARHHNIRTSVLKKISQNPAIRGIIFSGSLKRSLNYQEAVRFRNDFIFYDGDEAVFLKNPGTGGMVAGGSNFIPDKWLEVTRSSLNRYDTERQFHSHQTAIYESGIMLHSLYSMYKGSPAFYMKKILSIVGIIAGNHTILPNKSKDTSWQERMDIFLKMYDII